MEDLDQDIEWLRGEKRIAIFFPLDLEWNARIDRLIAALSRSHSHNLRSARAQAKAQWERAKAAEAQVAALTAERDGLLASQGSVPSAVCPGRPDGPHSAGSAAEESSGQAGEQAYYRWRDTVPDCRRGTPEAMYGFLAGYEAAAPAEARFDQAEGDR